MYCYNCMKEIDDNSIYCPFCHATVKDNCAPHHLKPGTVLNNRYLVGNSIGEGGFGITYIGRDLKLDMRIAVKEFYPAGFANRFNTYSNNVNINYKNGGEYFKSGVERFLQEAKSIAKFNNESSIVDVRDYFEENDTAYIIMEYLEGENLSEKLERDGTFEPEEIFKMFLPIMKTLEKMHRENIIHRDITPQNIRVMPDGSFKLIDFGSARYYDGVDKRTLSVQLKPGYAPIEQYNKNGNQGPWTDVYGLCATIYKCITGKTPLDSLERIQNDTLKKPSELGVKISVPLEKVLMQGLAVDSGKRCQNMNELINKTEFALSDEQSNLESKSVPEKSEDIYSNSFIGKESAESAETTGIYLALGSVETADNNDNSDNNSFDSHMFNDNKKTIERKNAVDSIKDVDNKDFQINKNPYDSYKTKPSNRTYGDTKYYNNAPHEFFSNEKKENKQIEPKKNTNKTTLQIIKKKKLLLIITACALALIILFLIIFNAVPKSNDKDNYKNLDLYQTTAEPMTTEQTTVAPTTIEQTTVASTTIESTTAVPTAPKVDPDLDLTSEIDAASDEEKTFSIGEDFFAYIDNDGQVHQFEINGSNVIEKNDYMDDNFGLVAIEFSPYSDGTGFGIKEDGSVILLSDRSTGSYDFTGAINHMSNVKDLVSFEMEETKKNGDKYYYAWIFCLHKDGTVIDYVFKDGEEVSYLPAYNSWNNIKSISIDFFVPIGLKTDGTLVKNEDGTPTKFKDYKNIAAIPQGHLNSTFGKFLKKNGTVECNNDLSQGETDPASLWTDIVEICDSDNTIGLKKDGTVIADGSNEQGQCNVSGWKNIVAVQTNKKFTVGKKSDGTFVIATNNEKLKKSFEEVVNKR